MSNSVFIDCGGFDGSSVRYYRSNFDSDCHIHTFEPNMNYWNRYGDFDNHTLHPVAAWDGYGYEKFYLSKYGWGSTLMKEKKSGKLNKRFPVHVHTIDLADWILKQNFESIILKMDIEGAEYRVVPHLYFNDVFSNVEKLYIEWHWDKIDMPKSEHDRVFKMVEDIVEPVEWNSIGY